MRNDHADLAEMVASLVDKRRTLAGRRLAGGIRRPLLSLTCCVTRLWLMLLAGALRVAWRSLTC